MTQPLNYTIKAIEDLRALRDKGTWSPHDRMGIDFIISKLIKAEVFVLPDLGQLLDRTKPRPEVAGEVYRPPHPIVALEYQSAVPGWTPTSEYDAAPSSRRIALAWDWDGVFPGPASAKEQHDVGEGVFVASISYYDNLGIWVPTGAALMMGYEAEYRVPDPSAYRDSMVASGRVSRKTAQAPTLVIRDMMTLLPDSMMQQIKKTGEQAAVQAFAADVMDEANAYSDLCLALACNNVSTTRNGQPDRLNRARIKAGKIPLKDFHVLKIAGGGDGGDAGQPLGSGGVRSHLRRGHVRRLSADRITWVNATMVRGSRPGFADKLYQINS